MGCLFLVRQVWSFEDRATATPPSVLTGAVLQQRPSPSLLGGHGTSRAVAIGLKLMSLAVAVLFKLGTSASA